MANAREGSSSSSAGNTFVNDGSFMEMFKRLQEHQKKSEPSEPEPVPPGREENRSKGATSEVVERKQGTGGGGGGDKLATTTTTTEKKTTEKTTVKIDTPLVKESQGVLLGKRKALMKSIELREKRKRRREELEQEQELAQKEGDKNKSSAWKAYMAQVKAYEAQNCTDKEGHRRPLVK